MNFFEKYYAEQVTIRFVSQDDEDEYEESAEKPEGGKENPPPHNRLDDIPKTADHRLDHQLPLVRHERRLAYQGPDGENDNQWYHPTRDHGVSDWEVTHFPQGLSGNADTISSGVKMSSKQV